MEERKRAEQQLHNILRSEELLENKELYEYYYSNKKYYSIDSINREYVYQLLKNRVRGRKVLDYCCGDGRYSFLCAQWGGACVGIDISDVSIANCKKKCLKEKSGLKPEFYVMDAEKTQFEDNSFDIIVCMGVLHHLDLKNSYRELWRIIKPEGEIICTEPLGHNPIIQRYRRATPHLRTKYEAEHILRIEDIRRAEHYFETVKTNFFHLATLAAVPFRRTVVFERILRFLEAIDAVLLKIPLIRTQAWMVVFKLSRPKKFVKNGS